MTVLSRKMFMDFAASIPQGAAAVSGVDRCIGLDPGGSGLLAYEASEVGLNPVQEITGRGGYLRKRGSVRESSQKRKMEPLSEVIRRACRQLVQSPAARSSAVLFAGGSLTGKQ